MVFKGLVNKDTFLFPIWKVIQHLSEVNNGL